MSAWKIDALTTTRSSTYSSAAASAEVTGAPKDEEEDEEFPDRREDMSRLHSFMAKGWPCIGLQLWAREPVQGSLCRRRPRGSSARGFLAFSFSGRVAARRQQHKDQQKHNTIPHADDVVSQPARKPVRSDKGGVVSRLSQNGYGFPISICKQMNKQMNTYT